MSIGKKVLFFLLIFFTFLYSDKDDLKFRKFPVAGIYDPNIWDLTQDKIGFMWFVAPDFGVFKFDGNKFQKYTFKGMKPNLILSINNGDVIVGAKNSLFKYDRIQDEFMNLLNLDSYEGNIRFLGKGQDDTIIFSTLKTVYKYNLKTNEHESILELDKINRLHTDDYKSYYLATKTGLFFMDTNKVENLVSEPINILALIKDKYRDKLLWYSGNRGLYKFNRETGTTEAYFYEKKQLQIYDLDFINKTDLLLSTNLGLYTFNTEKNKFTDLLNFDKNKIIIRNSYIDDNGTIWSGTLSGLLKTYQDDKINYVNADRDLINEYSNFIIQMDVTDDNDILFLNENNQLFVKNIHSEKLKYYEPFSQNNKKIKPSALLKIAKNKVLIGTIEGLFSYDLSYKKITKLSDKKIMYIERSDSNKFVFSDMSHVYFFNNQGEIFNKVDLINIMHHYQENDSIYWFLSQSAGIIKYNMRQKKEEERVDYVNFGRTVYNFITLDVADSCIYVGTKTKGVFLINLNNKEVINYNQKNGLPSNNILGIVKDGENFWVNTKNGLVLLKNKIISSKLDASKGFDCFIVNIKNKLKAYTFRNQKLLFKSRKGPIVVGGQNGICYFFPDKLFEKSSPSPLILTDIQVFGEPSCQAQIARQERTYKFSHKDRIITFSFAALNYQKLNTNKYSFLLEGFHKNWVFSDDNSITFNNLPPAKYQLRTRYSDYTGEAWQGPTYEIIITPPFWQTYSFWIIIIVVTGIGVFSVIKIQTYRIRNQKVSLEYRVLQRTKDLQEKKNELQRVNQGLEELVDVRTKKLTKTNKQLISEIEEKEKVYQQLQQSQEKIKSNLKMQTTLSDLSIKFISLENFKEKISNTLQTIGKEFGFSSVFLYQTSHFVQQKNTVIQWLKDDTIEKYADLTQQEYADYLAVLHSNGEILIEDAEEADVEIRNILEKIETRSLFIVPLMVGQKFYGFIGANKRQEKYSWDHSILHFLRTIGHMLAYAYDRRAFQSELLENEKTSRALLNASDSFAILFNSDARIELANQNFLKVINKSLDEAIGHQIYDFFPPAHIKERTRQFANCLKTKKVVEFEDQLNDQFYYNSITPIFDIDGKIVRIAFFSTNITKLKEAERILKRHQEELQKEVEARTKELRFINNELVREIKNRERAEEELRETEKVKRENLKKLALQLAHEIKNPLSSIKSSAQLVETIQTINPDVKSTIKHMDRITRNVDTCNRVIKELYEFTHDAELQIQKIKIGILFNEVIDYTESILENSLVSLKSESNIYDLCVSIDKFKLMQALKNIINNSKEAIMDEGEITIDFIEKYKVLNIRIADTGTGMKEEQLNKIFEPFFTSKSKGFGLGLAIVKKIIEQHRGTITVTSQIGKGTETIITLPCVIECNGEKNG
ncbi:MAG: ATP-binding protein [Fidelibacterota bacterium]